MEGVGHVVKVMFWSETYAECWNNLMKLKWEMVTSMSM